MKNVRDYLVIDVEATCDDGGTVPRHEMEIIEVGAVLADGRTFESKAEFQTFIRPVRHSRLTPFCMELTSIRQADVDEAPGFETAMEALKAFVVESSKKHQPWPLFCSWGQYDKNQFRQDAAYHRISHPLGPRHMNLKAAFSEAIGSRKKFGMAGALRRVGLSLEGTHHRGIDDARNITRLLPYIFGPKTVSAR